MGGRKNDKGVGPTKPSRFPPGFALRGKPRAILRSLLDEALRPEAELVADVEQYLASLERHAEAAEFVDLWMARRLAATAKELLRGLDVATPEEARRLVHAAVRYLVLEADAEPDGDPVGLEDDREVINAVCIQLKRTDLVVERP